MKQRKSYVLDWTKAVVLLLVVVMSLGIMTACTEDKTVSSIEVLESTNKEFYALEGFKISTFKLKVVYEDGSEGEIVAEESMLTTDGKNDLKTAGEKSVTLYYKGQTTTVDFTLVESGAELVQVTFKSATGSTITSKLTVVGGNVTAPEAPEVEGQYFDMWVDANGNEVSFSDLQSSITVTAHYASSQTKYKVVIKDYLGNILRSESIAAGEWVEEPSYSRPSTIREITWSVDFPVQVDRDMTITMQAVYESVTVQYAYAYQSSPKKMTYLNKYTETVEYGGKIDESNYAKAFAEVKKLFSGTITEPSDNHTVKSNTVFTFLVPDPSISITVYNDPERKSVQTEAIEYGIGNTYTFPLTAPSITISGKTFDSWRIYNSKGQVVSQNNARGSKWTVSEEYGESVSIVPYYRADYANVSFWFYFVNAIKNEASEDDDEKYYNVGIPRNEQYIPNDAEYGTVPFADITSLLKQIKENKQLIDDDSESDALQIAKDSVADCGIMKVVYKDNVYTSKDTIAVTSNSMTIKVYLLNKTIGSTGLAYTKVAYIESAPKVTLQEGETFEAYVYNGNEIDVFPYITGATFDIAQLSYRYVDAQKSTQTGTLEGVEAQYGYLLSSVDTAKIGKDNVFIPDTYKTGDDEEALPVIGVNNNVFENTAVTIGSISKDLFFIGNSAFSGCTFLDVESFDKVVKIGANAFEKASLQGNVSFGKASVLGEKAFSQLNDSAEEKETTVSLTFGAIRTVAKNAFADMDGSVTVNFQNDTVQEIGESAFSSSAGLTALNGLNNVKTVGKNAFFATGLTAIDLPLVETIGEKAFADMKSLQTVSLGQEGKWTQKDFDLSVLGGDEALTALAIGEGIENLELSSSLSGKYALESIALPKSAATIATGFFDAFTALQKITVATACEKFYTDDGVLYGVEKVDSVKTYTLIWYPTDKTGVYSVNLPSEEGITNKLVISPAALNTAVLAVLDVTSLGTSDITVADETMNATVYAVFAQKDGQMTQEKADKLSSTLYKDGVDASEAKYADIYSAEYKMLFTKGENDTVYVKSGYRGAKEITVPATVQDGDKVYTVVGIKKGAFSGFTSLEKLTVLATLDSFEQEVFGNAGESCSALTEITVAAWSSKAVFTGDKATVTGESFKYTKWYNDHAIISVGGHPFMYNKDAEATVITAEMLSQSGFSGKIPANFFSGAIKITAVSFPDDIGTVCEKAFAGCTSLVSVNFNKITKIDKEAFSGCTALLTANVPYLNTMGQGAFMTCKSLSEAKMPMLERIPVKAFYDCWALTTVDFSAVKTFAEDDNGSSAFANCSALEEISFPNLSADHIPGLMFYGSGLKSFDFSAMSTITGVDKQAFYGCTSLVYVVFGSNLAYIEDSAFAEHGVGTQLLAIRIPYGSKTVGLYRATVLDEEYYKSEDGKSYVARNAFQNTDVEFFIDEQYNPQDDTFLKDFKDKTLANFGNRSCISAVIPQVSFEFYEDYEGLSIGLSTKQEIYWTGVNAPDFTEQGYTFVGWYPNKTTTQQIEFPCVVTDNTTFYARYLSKTQGSLDAQHDVKFVYMIATEPEISLVDGETVAWKYSLNGVQTQIEAFPFVLSEDIDATSIISVFAEITSSAGTTKVEYGNIGRFGYAVMNYYSSIATDVLIPEYYDDGTNGQEPIVAIYAGAFHNEKDAGKDFVLKELDIPDSVVILVKGTNGKGFGKSLESISLPASLIYIENGVFDDATGLKVITFGEDSLLKEVSRDAFVHTVWYRDAVEEAEASNGFVLAGRTAIEYVGETKTFFITDKSTYHCDSGITLGVDTESTTEQTITVLYYNDNQQKTATVEYKGTGAKIDSGSYKIELTATSYSPITITFDVDEQGKYKQNGGVEVWFTETDKLAGIGSVRFVIGKAEILSIPTGVIKLADGILENNKNLVSLTVNANLEEIGKDAFKNTALATVKNGDSASNMKLSVIGKDAFAGTPWYQTGDDAGRVLIGSIFLQYNNKGYSKTVAIDDTVTAIADGAFSRTNNLENITFGSKSALVKIGANAFYNSSLRTVELPAGVEQIGRRAFAGCSNLLSADLSKTKLVKLEREVFADCTGLTSLKLPKTTVELGLDCVKGDTGLAEIQADGITSLKVSGEATQDGSGYELTFESALNDTAWYQVNAKDSDDDIFLTLGSVLVRYCMGKTNKEKAQSAVDAENKETVLVQIPEALGVVTILDYAFTANTESTPNSYSGSNVYLDIVQLSSTVREIGTRAFVSCSTLKEVRFATNSSLVSIGAFAFYDCSSLSTVVLPEGLSEIGQSAFQKTAIKTVVENENGERVSDNGFIIPSTVLSIGKDAFAGIDELTVVSLNSALTDIGLNAFNEGNTGKLYKVLWDIDTEEIKDDQGVLVDNGFIKLNTALKGKDTNVQMKNFFVSGTNIRIYFDSEDYDYLEIKRTTGASTTYSLWKDSDKIVFKEEGDYPKVTLSTGTETVDYKYEFIQDGELPTPSKEGNTFRGWQVQGGSAVSYPYTVTSEVTFEALWIENAPESKEKMVGEGNATFEISAITDSTTEISITKVSGEVLYVVESIAGIKVNSFSLQGNTSVKKLILTSAVNFNGQTVNPFAGFTALESISMPNDADEADFVIENVTLTYTTGEGDSAKVCTKVCQVIYSADKTKLIAFIGNASYTQGEEEIGLEFAVPNGVTEIYQDAFVNSHLATISLPATLTKIGARAFNEEIKSFKIAKNIYLTEADYNIFADTASEESFFNTTAKSANYDSYVEVKGAKVTATDKSGSFYILGNIVLAYKPANTKVDQELTFLEKSNEFDLTVLAENMLGLVNDTCTFTKVTFPKNVKKINKNAFKKCDIKAIGDGEYNSLNDIADDVFANKTFYDSHNSGMLQIGHVLVKAVGTASVVEVPEGVVLIMKDAFANSKATTVKLPSTLVTISDEAFSNEQKLTSIEIPSSVVTIGNKAFYGCSALASVTFDTVNSKILSIGDRAFNKCEQLTEIMLPYSLQNIGKFAFAGCTGLTEITFDGYEQEQTETGSVWKKVKDSKLSVIGEGAFSTCSSLTAIDIPNGVTAIEQRTFENCVALLTIGFDITNSKLSSIGESAFSGCVKLGSKLNLPASSEVLSYVDNNLLVTLELPNALVSVGDNAFSGCEGLWGVEFNFNIESLGSSIFAGCNNLVKVVFNRSTPAQIQADTFNVGNEAKYRLRIYVPKTTTANENATYGTSMEKYIKAWKDVTINNTSDGSNGESIKYFLYEQGDLPTFYYANKNGSETSKEMRGEVVINPYYKWVNTTTTGAQTYKEAWEYGLLQQGTTTDGGETYQWYYGLDSDFPATEGERDGKVYQYGSQTIGDYVICIIDYDYVELKEAE